MTQGLQLPCTGVEAIIFKHVYWYMQRISGERLQDHWSSGCNIRYICILSLWINQKQINILVHPFRSHLNGFLCTHTVHTARQFPTGTSNSRCLCQRVRFGG